MPAISAARRAGVIGAAGPRLESLGVVRVVVGVVMVCMVRAFRVWVRS